MEFLRNHWYDLGGVLALLTIPLLILGFHNISSGYRLLMLCNLVSLLLHQLEEYRIAGTFPGMINTVLYKSPHPENFPLNPQTSLVINVGIGWTTYALAAIFAERALWLGMATILVSAGNVIAHTVLFNVRGRSLYNAGMATAVLLFLPLVVWFFRLVVDLRLAGPWDYVAGVAAGIILNVVGVLKMIDWMADRESPYAFRRRQLLRRPPRS